MKNKQIIDSWNKIEPDAASDARMRSAIIKRNSAAVQTRQALHSFTRRVAIIATIALLTVTVTVVAVGHYLGSFDILRGIIGSERADTLQPVGIGRVVGSFVTDDRFSVELVAVGVMANVVDMYITIEDLSGERRLDGDVSVGFWLSLADDPMPLSASARQFSEIIHRTDCGIVTFHNRHAFLHSVTERELEFHLLDVFYNFRTSELSIDIDLSTVTEQTPVAWLWDTPILPPNLHDIDLALPGFEHAGSVRVSGIGIIDGRLHIQERYDWTALHRWTDNIVRLIDPHGEIVRPLRGTYDNTASISFGIDEQGNIYNDKGYNFATFFNRENIFEVDTDRLAEYSLVAVFDAEEQARVSWQVRFEVDVPDEGMELLVADGLELYIAQYATTIYEIRVSPFSVMLTGFQTLYEDGMTGLTSIEVRIHTDDGAVIDVKSRWARVDTYTHEIAEIRDIATDYLDLDTVVSIEIAGEVIEFRGATY